MHADTQINMQAAASVKCEAGLTALECLVIPFFQHTFILGHASGRHDCFQRAASEASFCGILMAGIPCLVGSDCMACGVEQFPLHVSCPHSGPPVPVYVLEISFPSGHAS